MVEGFRPPGTYRTRCRLACDRAIPAEEGITGHSLAGRPLTINERCAWMQITMDMTQIDPRPAAFWVAFTTMLSLSAVALAMLVFVLS